MDYPSIFQGTSWGFNRTKVECKLKKYIPYGDYCYALIELK